MRRRFQVWMVICFVSCVFLLSSVASRNSQATLIYLEGDHTVTYRFPSFIDEEFPQLRSYSNNGFQQEVKGGELWQTVEVTSNMNTLTTKTDLPLNLSSIPSEVRIFLKPSILIQADDPTIQSIRNLLIEQNKPQTVADMVRITTIYVKDLVKYDLRVSQDALTALEQRRGSCVGISSLVAAILRSTGIPTRVVFGYNFPERSWAQQDSVFTIDQIGSGCHLWLEVFYPDAGWVFTDPVQSINNVDVFHLVFQIARDETVNPQFLKRIGKTLKAFHQEVETFNEQERIELVGIKQNEPQSVNLFARITPSDQVQFVGTLQVQILSASSSKPISTAKLHHYRDDKSYYIHEVDSAGAVTLPLLEPGLHIIAGIAPGYTRSPKITITVEKGHLTSRTVYLEKGGEIACRILDEKGRPVTIGKLVLWSERKGKVYKINRDGTVNIEGIQPGNYLISVKKTGYPERQYTIVVKPGKKTKKTIRLEK